MAITFLAARLNPSPYFGTTFPPGDVLYPDAYDEFIDLSELTAQEVEAARQGESSLLVNLQTNYVTSTLTENIVGNGFKLTGMAPGAGLDWTYPNADGLPDSPGSQDYLTVGQWSALMPTTADFTDVGFNVGFTIPNSQFIVANATDFAAFDYQPDTLETTGIYLYPAALNKTYYVDWNSESETLIDLDKPFSVVPIPILGDRLRFIMANPGVGDGIQAATKKINSLGEKITFGEVFAHAIYDLVYTGNPTGWLFKNVILG